MSENGHTRIEFVLEKLNGLLALFGIISLLSLTVLITVNVMMRYLFNAPLSWGDEFATYFLVGIVFFGLAYALEENAHIRVDFVTRLLPPKLQTAFSVFAHLVGLFFAVLLFLGAYSRVHSFWALNTHSMGEFPVPLFIPSLPLVLGAGMLLVFMVVRTCRLFISLVLGQPGGRGRRPYDDVRGRST